MSNFFQADVDANVQDAYKEASEGGGGKFPPLPKGEYRGTIVPLKSDGSKRVEIADFGGTGPNSGKKVLRVAVKIAADSPTGAGRTFFGRIPMFSRYAPNDKNPQGAPARSYFDFWGKVIGVPEENLLSGQLGVGPDHILGKPVNFVLAEPTPPDAHNPLGSNEISFWNKPGPANTPLRQPGVPVAPWLDASDNLLAGFQPVQQGAPQPQAQAAPQGSAWGVTPQDVSDAQTQAQAAAPQGGIQPGAWANAPSY